MTNLFTRARAATVIAAVAFLCASAASAAEPASPDYTRDVEPIFRKYCSGCHNAKEAEGELILESFAQTMKGGTNGAIVVAGDAAKSRMILSLEGKIEPSMPPEGNKAPTKEEIAVLAAWITAGAKGPAEKSPAPQMLVTPKIQPIAAVRKPITALAWSSDGKSIVTGRYQSVEVLSAADSKSVKMLDGAAGTVNDLGFSADGSLLFAATGEPGLFGETVVWKTADWSRTATIRGHADSVYAAALSPDGKLLATGGYDQAIYFWDSATGKEIRKVTGHNGPVFDLAFHPTGKILASASGDRTVKLWNVESGERLDTLNQPTKDQYTVAFSPDGKKIAAGGVDNRIRIWDVREMGREGTNPILETKFAHEAPIIKVAFTPDGKKLVSSAEDRTVKVWDAGDYSQITMFDGQSDWTPAMAISPEGNTVAVGRLDGSLGTYALGSVEHSASRNMVRIDTPPIPPMGKEMPMPAEAKEAEPNDAFDKAQAFTAPGVLAGTITPSSAAQDVDLYRFESKAGQTWIVETSTKDMNSKADTRIDVLDAGGKPVLRYLLRAVRDSYITFRPIDSKQGEVRVENWEEMQLNQFLYMDGEICRIHRMPRGPDSGFAFYQINGDRRCYFDTSGVTHAKDSSIYVVEPYAPGTVLPDNGLPVFPLYYTNDDDGERKKGSDSRVTFTAPADGAYLVRVTDVRGTGGPDFTYKLIVRKPKPDFAPSIGGDVSKVAEGSGLRFTTNLDRIDGFDGDVRFDITGVPAGYQVTTPIVVQAGHISAQGVINALPGAKTVPAEEWAKVKIVATSTLHGQKIEKEVRNFGAVQLQPKPKVLVKLELDEAPKGDTAGKTPELVIAPGTTITARLRVERNGFDGDLRFDVDNLPHGIIVDNIGLSGILVRAKETERQVFLTAAAWVPETSRLIHAVTQSEGGQASLPILLTVRRDPGIARNERAVNGQSAVISSGK